MIVMMFQYAQSSAVVHVETLRCSGVLWHRCCFWTAWGINLATNRKRGIT